MQLIFSLILLIYLIQQILFILVIAKIKQKRKENGQSIFISIIIPIKNEATNLETLLNSFETQSYPTTLFELILVNDSSTDKSLELIHKHKNISKLNINTLSLTSNEKGKKIAILKGAKVAKSEWIITTDADTLRNKDFIASSVDFLTSHKNMVLCFGNVIMSTDKSFLQNFQHIEYSVLQAVSIASSLFGTSVLGSAANMCVKKDILLQSNLKTKYCSGDDVFLLQWIKKTYGAKSVGWNFQKESAVETYPKNTWKDFWRQRIRWVGKTTGYSDFVTILVSVIAYLTNLSLLAFPFFATKTMWILIFSKPISDILLYSVYKYRFLNKEFKISFLHIIFTAIIYPIYLTLLVPTSIWFAKKQPW